jgi:hypothetical protein
MFSIVTRLPDLLDHHVRTDPQVRSAGMQSQSFIRSSSNTAAFQFRRPSAGATLKRPYRMHKRTGFRETMFSRGCPIMTEWINDVEDSEAINSLRFLTALLTAGVFAGRLSAQPATIARPPHVSYGTSCRDAITAVTAVGTNAFFYSCRGENTIRRLIFQ